MKANPGGQIPLDDVIGRNELIQDLWDILEKQSIVLTSVRRIGKTHIIKKMVEENPKGRFVIYRDVEGLRTPLEFADLVFKDVENYLSKSKKYAVKARKLISNVSGLQLGEQIKIPESLSPHWKELLVTTIEDLMQNQNSQTIFFWDEMPLMLFNIKQSINEETAIELLDTLRSLRQMHPNLRMVFTGSIGLHNVISSLKKVGYPNSPTNDMYIADVPTLSGDVAVELAMSLLEGEKISTNDLEKTSLAIIREADCFPYYIHHIVDQLKHKNCDVTPSVVHEIVNEGLTHPQDRWHLSHYRERIKTYYDPDDEMIALTILDIVALEEVISFDKLFNLLKSRIATENTEKAREVLNLLQRDHYIIINSRGEYSFRFSLIKRWWTIHRGLNK